MSRWTVFDVFKLDGLPAFDPTSDEDRFAALRQISTTHEPGQQIPDGRITTIAHQSILHQAFVLFFFLIFVLGAVFWVPLSLIYLGLFGSWSAFAAAFAATLVAIFIPAPRAVWSLTCSVAKWFTRYTSYRIVWEGTVEDLSFKDKPVFGLVPPHGVFPMQNILVHLVLPAITGRYVRGMAADALLAVPLTRHVLCAIGGIPATRAAALQALDLGFLSGVSPDGIAGIFEVNSDDEVVVILSRTGIYKIACKAGTPIWVTYTVSRGQYALLMTPSNSVFSIVLCDLILKVRYNQGFQCLVRHIRKVSINFTQAEDVLVFLLGPVRPSHPASRPTYDSCGKANPCSPY